MKPLIGITANFIKDDQFGVDAHIGGPGQEWQALANDYVNAIVKAGGIPVILPVLSTPEEAAAYVEQLDGILFSGGCDVSPLVYGERVTKEVGEICTERDEQELVLAQATLKTPGFPVMGICRGCQLLNVAAGGTLVVDIDTSKLGDHFLMTQRMTVPTHKVAIQDGSQIQEILDGEDRVNSYHHQCVGTPGEGVVVTARDSHGVPECIEMPQRKGFALATQWHPEGLVTGGYSGHLNIFKAFVQAAADFKDGRK